MRETLVKMAAATLAIALSIATPAAANTRSGAGSYMNSRQLIRYSPSASGYFWTSNGTLVWMDCWTRGPLAMGQYKWFRVTVRQSSGYGVSGYVPAPSVSNQWDSSPLC